MQVVIIGAGLSGLVAAHELSTAGVDVVVVDKGRSVGGRLATRRIGDDRFDHGAQFFTVRSPAFRHRVDDWLDRGVVQVWNHGFGESDEHPRYIGTAGMNSIAKDLAAGLGPTASIETSTMAFEVRPARIRGEDDHRWEVVIDDGTTRGADAVILTCPIPQALALLVDSGVELDGTLMRTEYDRTIAILAVLDRPAPLPASGGVQDPDDVFSFIGDNTSKGIATRPAITFHANPSWSETNWDRDVDLVDLLTAAATPHLGDATILDLQVKKWRLATPRSIWPDPCWTAAESTIVLAGDAFAGPRIEGAHNSGMAAAHALLD